MTRSMRFSLCFRQRAVNFAHQQAGRVAIVVDADHKIAHRSTLLILKSFRPSPMGFKLVYLGFADYSIGKLHGCSSFPFAPAAFTVRAFQFFPSRPRLAVV